MTIDPNQFRRIMRCLPTGVTIVASYDARTGEPHGLTANAVTSVSLDPVLLLVCIERSADTHDCIRDAGRFSVNVLGREAEPLARRFAIDGEATKFDGVRYRREVTGAPVLDDALAWADCTVWDRFPAGDHTIFVGRVVAGDAGEGSPLLFYRGEYGRIEP